MPSHSSNISGNSVLAPRAASRRANNVGHAAAPNRLRFSNVVLLILAALIFTAMVPLLVWEMPMSEHGLHMIGDRIHLSFESLQHPGKSDQFSLNTDVTAVEKINRDEKSHQKVENVNGSPTNLRVSSTQQQNTIREHSESNNGVAQDQTKDDDNDDQIQRAKKPLARGVSGLPMAATPALFEAQRGHIECDVNVDFLAYWNDPQGVYDRTFVSPFADHGSAGQTEKYVTFESDSGGWNNIRMAMEIVVVFTLATGRTLVMPPDQVRFYFISLKFLFLIMNGVSLLVTILDIFSIETAAILTLERYEEKASQCWRLLSS